MHNYPVKIRKWTYHFNHFKMKTLKSSIWYFFWSDFRFHWFKNYSIRFCVFLGSGFFLGGGVGITSLLLVLSSLKVLSHISAATLSLTLTLTPKKPRTSLVNVTPRNFFWVGWLQLPSVVGLYNSIPKCHSIIVVISKGVWGSNEVTFRGGMYAVPLRSILSTQGQIADQVKAHKAVSITKQPGFFLDRILFSSHGHGPGPINPAPRIQKFRLNNWAPNQ